MTIFHGRIRRQHTAFNPASLPNNSSYIPLPPPQNSTPNGCSSISSLSPMFQRPLVVLAYLPIISFFAFIKGNFMFSFSSSFLSFYYASQHNVLVNEPSKYYILWNEWRGMPQKLVIWYVPSCHTLFST